MKKVGVIFGGMSTENEISKISAKSVLENLDKNKYEIYQIYIDKSGNWFEYPEMKEIENIMQKGDVILFKASNFMKLFNVVEKLKEQK